MRFCTAGGDVFGGPPTPGADGGAGVGALVGALGGASVGALVGAWLPGVRGGGARGAVDSFPTAA